jgi:hypothetical protein
MPSNTAAPSAYVVQRVAGSELSAEQRAANNKTDDEEDGGTQQMIALWEKAESDAIQAALKPLSKNMAEARFEIVPVKT